VEALRMDALMGSLDEWDAASPHLILATCKGQHTPQLVVEQLFWTAPHRGALKLYTL